MTGYTGKFARLLSFALAMACMLILSACDEKTNVMQVPLTAYYEMDESKQTEFVKLVLKYFADEGHDAAGSMQLYQQMLQESKLRADDAKRPGPFLKMGCMPAWLIAQKMGIEPSFRALWEKQTQGKPWVAADVVKLALQDIDALDPDDLVSAAFAMEAQVRALNGFADVQIYPINALWSLYQITKPDLDNKTDMTKAPGSLYAYFLSEYGVDSQTIATLTGVDIGSGAAAASADGPALEESAIELDTPVLMDETGWTFYYPSALYSEPSIEGGWALLESIEPAQSNIMFRIAQEDIPGFHENPKKALSEVSETAARELAYGMEYEFLTMKYLNGDTRCDRELKLTDEGKEYSAYMGLGTEAGYAYCIMAVSKPEAYETVKAIAVGMLDSIELTG